MIGSTTVRLVALVVALVFLGLGILGALPPLHTEWTTAPDSLIVRNGIGLLLGFLPNNIVLTVTRLAVGLAGVAAARHPGSAVWFLRCVAVGSALLTGLALLPSVETAFGVAPIAGANLWLHLVVALTAGVAGWNPFAHRVLRAAPASSAVATSATAAGLLHRLLAPLPFVCFLGVLLTDLAFWWTTHPWYNGSGPFWARASIWLIGAGFAVGVVYALVGAYARWRGRPQRDRAVTTSTLLPAVGLVLAGANVYFRSTFDTDPIPFGIALSAATAASFALTYRGGLAAHPRDRPGSD